MPTTPVFAFRLKQEQRIALAEVARINGNSSVSSFLRQMIEALCGSDEKEAERFALRLMERAGQQMKLHLAEVEQAKERIDTLAAAVKPVEKARSQAIRREKRGRRAKRSK
jgi:phosphoglycolate phosphatase-like HAD superfamily hydrolase